MGSYLFRRLLNLIPILIGISFLSFVLINLSPSDPAEVAVRVNEVTPTEEVLAETRAKLGLDKPFLTRYVAWLNNSLHGDFGNRYVELSGNVLGNIRIRLPEGHTWRSYAEFLLDTMPPPTAEHYREKINTFLKWWAKHGFEEIPQEADPKLESRRKAPSWRRICKTLLKNDYWCKGLSFGQTKRDMGRQAQTIMKYMEL